MQWILQDFEDTRKLADVLERLGIVHSWHKVIPFVGELIPEPTIEDSSRVIMFGSYALWRYARDKQLSPGVYTLRPFVHEAVWHPHLLNGTDALFLTLAEISDMLPDDGRDWFMRPVDDSKAEPGRVRDSHEIHALAKKVSLLDPADIPNGSLRPDTALMLTHPVNIQQEWRLWAVAGRIVTYSLYKQGARVVYRSEIDNDALVFAQRMVDLNSDYAPAYVIDICRTQDGLHLLETNCLNAAGFYAADLAKLVIALEDLDEGHGIA